MASQFKPIAILGAGSWGTALALYLARRGQRVRIWSIEKDEINAMLLEKVNSRYLPGFTLPDLIQPTPSLADTVALVDEILVVVPSVGFRDTLNQLKPLINADTSIICASKGLDTHTGKLFSEVAAEVLSKRQRFAVLSGPTFAREVAAGLPTAAVIASLDSALVTKLVARFSSSIFHIYPSDDLIGVEIGGAVKNVIAIATGIADGLDFGANARNALITHGLEEIIRLGVALGAKQETFIGLSGLGDLILTCSDNQSRNRRLGLALGKGKDITAAEQEIGQVVEGKRNAELVSLLSKQKGIHMPICSAIWEILQGKIQAKEVIPTLI